MHLISKIRFTGAAALPTVCALHVAWGCGSSWPAKNRTELARAIIGGNRLPGAGPTWIVAGLLAAAAALVAGLPSRGSALQRGGAGIVTAVMGVRAIAGFAGLMPQERRSETFRRWNRRLYSPLCLLIALACSPAIASEP